MLHHTLLVAAAVIYSLCALQQWRSLRTEAPVAPATRWAVLAGLLLHGGAVITCLVTPQGINLAMAPVLILLAWVVTALALATSLVRPVRNIFVLLLPANVLAILLSLLLPAGTANPLPHGIGAHVLFSLLAYGMLSLSGLQALLLGLQERELRRRQPLPILRALPPLQTMESLLFQGLWIGMLLLTLAILTGWMFVEDLFAQHLLHKTVLTLFAWLIFATLLAGHILRGWRGTMAVRWTLGGLAALVLAFLGSKLVLEVILHRVQ